MKEILTEVREREMWVSGGDAFLDKETNTNALKRESDQHIQGTELRHW